MRVAQDYKLSSIMDEPREPVETSHSLTVQSELGVAIRSHTINVPASPIDRATRVANDFAASYLRRPFSWDSDFIHLSTDFDSTVSKPTWNARDQKQIAESLEENGADTLEGRTSS